MPTENHEKGRPTCLVGDEIYSPFLRGGFSVASSYELALALCTEVRVKTAELICVSTAG